MVGQYHHMEKSMLLIITKNQFIYRHKWSKDDVIMWDNRCSMHCVETFDNLNVRRIMHRVTLTGENEPIPAAGN